MGWPCHRVESMESTSRQFTDDRGELWNVWPVYAESLERRIAEDRLLTRRVERRMRRADRVRVTNPLMANGWLAFESRTERRRFAPIPHSWSEMDETALRSLLVQAKPAGAIQRLLK
jgi:hypothetical protein